MDDDAQRRRCRETYGAMEKGPFSFPSPPFTLQPSGKIIHTYYDLYNHIDDWRDPVLYEETHNGDPVPYDERHLNGHVELVPTAPSRYSGPIQYSYLYDASSHPGGHIELVVPTAPSRPDIARYLAPLRYPAAPLLYSCDTSLVPAACSQGGRRYRGFDPGAGAPSSYPTALVPAACSRNGALEGGHDYWNMDTGAGAPSRCRGTDLGRAEGSRHRALEASRRSRHRALEASHRSRHGALEASRRSRSVDPGARERTRRRRSIDIDPAAPSRYQIAPSRHCRGAIRVGSSRSHHEVVEGGAASSGSHHGDSLYAGAAHHFGAAARYMEEAERRRRGGDPELGLDDAVLSGDGSDNDDSGDGCNGDGLCGLLLDVMCGGGSNELLALLFSLLFGMCIGADTDAGEDRVSKRFYELFYPVLAFIPPYLLCTLLPGHVVRGVAWACFLIFYGFFITIVTTVVSVRALSSCCCTSKCLRTLLFVASVAAEVLAYMHVIPDTKFARGGTLFYLFHLITMYLLAWTPSFRRRLHNDLFRRRLRR